MVNLYLSQKTEQGMIDGELVNLGPNMTFQTLKHHNLLPVLTACSKIPTLKQGTKIRHLSARIYEWILERTSDSSQSARPTGRVLKSAGETSIF